MNTSKVEICGVNTALLPVLNEEQKTQLLLAAKAGNSEARAQMIQGNLRQNLSRCRKRQQQQTAQQPKADFFIYCNCPHPSIR